MSFKDLRQMVGNTAMIAMFVAALVELGLVTSRVFRDEVQAHTLPLLMMLPKSTAEIAWSKAASVLPSLIPAAVYFLIGALLNIEDFGRVLEHVVFTWGVRSRSSGSCSFCTWPSFFRCSSNGEPSPWRFSWSTSSRCSWSGSPSWRGS